MIVFPMAGLSRRFTDAGYKLPKYMLDAHGETLFSHAVRGFSAYFESEKFLFIARDVHNTCRFIRDECARLGIKNIDVLMLDAPTDGQAHTVALGLSRSRISPDTPATIFNIDTFRHEFRFPTSFNISDVDGYLEVFRGEGENWSYVRADIAGSNRVIETTEKVPISDLCCTGLYHFGSVSLFMDAYSKFATGGAAAMGLKELYIAPMYNLLIQRGADIRYDLIKNSEVIFCGIPSEYEAFLKDIPFNPDR